jgi:hypothetical protein
MILGVWDVCHLQCTATLLYDDSLVWISRWMGFMDLTSGE